INLTLNTILFKLCKIKKLDVVIRNVPTSLSEEEVKNELLLLGFPVATVARLLPFECRGHL
ncbi:hypothetical protein, partial [Klebsiella pneumoniae]|uniref:hypothetical protein n=1 Tax=Klebsiella pneumoniae TaxID=573 RepID=UPI001C8F7831